MERIEILWGKVGKPFFGLGLFLATIGLVLSFFIEDIEAIMVIYINAGAWLAGGSYYLIKSKLIERKLNRFKEDGVCYDGLVVTIIPSYYIRVASYMASKAKCTYVNRNGETCSVKSHYYLLTALDNKDNLIPKIHVNPDNPSDYMVELFRENGDIPKIDLDYTKSKRKWH